MLLPLLTFWTERPQVRFHMGWSMEGHSWGHTSIWFHERLNHVSRGIVCSFLKRHHWTPLKWSDRSAETYPVIAYQWSDVSPVDYWSQCQDVKKTGCSWMHGGWDKWLSREQTSEAGSGAWAEQKKKKEQTFIWLLNVMGISSHSCNNMQAWCSCLVLTQSHIGINTFCLLDLKKNYMLKASLQK